MMPVSVQPTAPQRPFRVLVCGGRDFDDRRWLDRVLDGLHSAEPIFCIIQGGARGADTLAARWAHDRCVPLITFFADWTKHGKAAGAIRNQEMLEVGQPQLVVAFPGGRGTADMMRRAEKDDAVSTMSVSRSASADGRRMAETENTGSGRSPTSAVGSEASETPNSHSEAPDNG